jgi:hypothetical protein
MVGNSYHRYALREITLDNLLVLGSILVVFAVLEAALLTAVGLFSTLSARKSRAVQLALALCLRALPILAIILIWQTSVAQIEQFYEQRRSVRGDPNFFSDGIVANEARSWQRLLDTVQVTLSTQVDGGMVSVNLVSTSAYYNPNFRIWFVLRQCVALLLGMGLYLLLILSTLRAAEKIAIRRGALPPP